MSTDAEDERMKDDIRFLIREVHEIRRRLKFKYSDPEPRKGRAYNFATGTLNNDTAYARFEAARLLSKGEVAVMYESLNAIHSPGIPIDQSDFDVFRIVKTLLEYMDSEEAR